MFAAKCYIKDKLVDLTGIYVTQEGGIVGASKWIANNYEVISYKGRAYRTARILEATVGIKKCVKPRGGDWNLKGAPIGFERAVYCHQDGRVSKPRLFVSREGEVIGGRGMAIKLKDHKGYMRADKFFVHRLVTSTFIGAPRDGQLEVNHIDGVKSNNRLENLEWIDRKGNVAHAIKNGLVPNMSPEQIESRRLLRTEKKRLQIIGLLRRRLSVMRMIDLAKQGLGHTAIQRETGIDRKAVRAMCRELSIPLHIKHKYTKDDALRIAQRFYSGESFPDIAESMGLSRSSKGPKLLLKRHGLHDTSHPKCQQPASWYA